MTIAERPLGDLIGVQYLGAGDTWHDIGGAATGISIARGGARSALGVKVDTGLLTFRLFGTQDPLDGTADLKPGLTVRAVQLTGATPRPLFTGKIKPITASYPLVKATGEQRSYTTVTVVDAVDTHVATPRYGVTSIDGFETFEARIARLESSARAPIALPDPGAPKEVYAL